MKIYRQGDIVLKSISGLPSTLKRIRNNVLAEGETTGHKHELCGDVHILEGDKGQKFVIVIEAAALRHDEHKMITVAPGWYQVLQEREYSVVRKISVRSAD